MHFWCNFLGIKKVYKVENQLLVDYSERRGRDWLLRSWWSLRLTPFPSACRRGPCKPTAQKAASCIFCFICLCLQVNLRQRYKKQKVSISRYLFALWSCGERGIRTPGASQLNGFQDRRNRPLCHLSKGQKYNNFFNLPNKKWKYFYVFYGHHAHLAET